MSDDERDRRGPRHRTPTKAQRSIESALLYGSNKPSDAAPEPLERPEPTTPILTPVVSATPWPELNLEIARIAERQRDALQRDLAIATALGDLRLDQREANVSLLTMARLAEKDDARKDAAAAAAAELAKTTAQLKAEDRKSSRATWKEITIAVLGLLGIIAGAYGLGTRSAAPGAQIQMTTPAAPPQVPR